MRPLTEEEQNKANEAIKYLKMNGGSLGRKLANGNWPLAVHTDNRHYNLPCVSEMKICLPASIFKESIRTLASTLAHEKIHILQATWPGYFHTVYTERWGWHPVSTIQTAERVNNPDERGGDYAYQDQKGRRYVPILVGKPPFQTKWIPIEDFGNSGFPGNASSVQPNILPSFVQAYHPHEIFAYYAQQKIEQSFKDNSNKIK